MMAVKGKKTVPVLKDGVTRIKAMRDGVESYFSEMAWEIGNLERHGWMKVGVMSDAVKVESEEIVISEIPSGDTTIVDTGSEADDIYPTDDEIRDFLKEKGVKFHHATGTKKLRRMFDENKK